MSIPLQIRGIDFCDCLASTLGWSERARPQLNAMSRVEAETSTGTHNLTPDRKLLRTFLRSKIEKLEPFCFHLCVEIQERGGPMLFLWVRRNNGQALAVPNGIVLSSRTTASQY